MPHSIFLDDGASVDLMDEAFANSIEAIILPTKVMLTTSTEQSAAGVIGATEVIPIVYGDGPNAIISPRSFLMVKNRDSLH